MRSLNLFVGCPEVDLCQRRVYILDPSPYADNARFKRLATLVSRQRTQEYPLTQTAQLPRG